MRCPWSVSAADYLAYHDTEWATPVHDDVGMFERVCLEAFQAGLSWLVVLRKRAALRAAFAGFRPEVVAEFGEDDVARVLADPGVIRNVAKVRAVIGNARCALAVPGGLAAHLWSFAPRQHGPAPVRVSDVPATSAESVAMAADLRRRGFRFVGPTTAYALMQASGMVDDHLAGCWRRAAG